MKFRIKYFTAVAVMLSAAVSCSYSVEDAPFFNEESAPAMPCLISGDTTLLIVRDYFPRIEKVDAVSSP